MLQVNPQIAIPETELQFSFARSPGPGGQNVNKVNSKAILRWSMVASEALPDEVKRRLKQQQKNRITVDGELVISSHRYRDQPRNVADCREKLKAIILAAAEKPKRRKKTRVPRSVIERRLENKKRNADKKKSRGRVRPPE